MYSGSFDELPLPLLRFRLPPAQGVKIFTDRRIPARKPTGIIKMVLKQKLRIFMGSNYDFHARARVHIPIAMKPAPAISCSCLGLMNPEIALPARTPSADVATRASA